MSVLTIQMAVSMGESASTLSTIIVVAVAIPAVTTVRIYQTSVICLALSVTTVFATMTTTSSLLSVCVTSPTIRVSVSLLTSPTPCKENPSSAA